ncbi:PAS domain S-box protein [Granulicella sp. 5B5]|uniref:sensor histidine kinase n=1 Tax=Granulicella sp. 5B5 TaxID=1617967 RepID=UPI0015F35976|nr:PAS domain-containing sensor histidine kinase [Granulicella sp. 5B5]QMV17530.1 PAS domain S-box protein [Granulicella sp. 5B5]
MLPTSHYSPIDTEALPTTRSEIADPAHEAHAEMVPLAEAFAHFIQSSSRLEEVYRKLQMQINILTEELDERNDELKKSLAQNEAMRSTLQQIVNTMPCGVLVVRVDGTIALINPECCSLLGIAVPNAGMELAAVTESLGEKCVHLLRSVQGLDGEHEFHIAVEGSVRWISVHSRSVDCGDEMSVAYDRILVLRDVTERRRAEEDRDRGRNAMALSEVALMLAHEIRNPLASLELFSELIEQDGERRPRWISELRAGIRLLSSTVNNVLSLQGQNNPDFMPVEIESVVAGAIALLRPVAQQASVKLLWQATGAEVFVMGNGAGLQQVMVNLVMNGIRHTPAGGSVAISVSRAGTEGGRELMDEPVVIECVDSGLGIAEFDSERLFEAGYSGLGKSPGLGLAVCKRILQQHGGRVSVTNVPAGGARFVVEIPVVQGECAA